MYFVFVLFLASVSASMLDHALFIFFDTSRATCLSAACWNDVAYEDFPPEYYSQIIINPVIQIVSGRLEAVKFNQPHSKEVVCSRVVKGLRDTIGGDLLRPLCAMLFIL